MRVFFSLIIFSFMLATCQGACGIGPLVSSPTDAMAPKKCVDPNDRRKHLIVSTWNTADCLRCECDNDGLSCCHRYGGLAERAGCKSVLNQVTCEYEFYRLDDLSKRCDA
uniref:Small serum protein 2 n=2 Tax=Protobothrops flavoviridis TaxID=88087 RepID=MSMB2_PROFL|nr:RecName: Full=Small serum protein 2; Short=SSP-2; Flags: Precursor [Protobothrops flavoviridis]QGB21041.1 PfSSP-2 precursor [Protobothrops flavoviridis]6IMF_B Chain B, Small serum protein 2 [Protobothrops flavoviridis]BAF80052.1 small serum protein-2 [Protobothrops flavoviridis]BAM72533.1 small serum protein-2 [Protobothrops flavoviridis]